MLTRQRSCIESAWLVADVVVWGGEPTMSALGLAVHPGQPRGACPIHALESVGNRDQPSADATIALSPRPSAQLLARLGSPLQRGRDCRAVQSASAGTQAEAERRADGGIESGGTGRSRSDGGQNRAVARRRSVPVGGGALGCRLQRDWDAESVVVARSVASEDPTAPPAEQREGSTSF